MKSIARRFRRAGRANFLPSKVTRLRYTPFPYLIVAALFALGALYAVSGGLSFPLPKEKVHSEAAPAVVTRYGIYVRDANSTGYVKVR